MAHFVTYNTILDIQRGSFAGRYLFIFVSFLASGIFHLYADIAQRVPIQESGSIRFYCMQVLGIIFEDLVQATYKRVMGDSEPVVCSRRSGLRVLGYLWVATWLVWTCPAWVYPALRRSGGEPILPFSPIGLLTGR